MMLSLTNFGNHRQTDLKLPDQGVVVFHGPNGAGKSMIGEAITYCLWSDTVRSSRVGWSPVDDATAVSLSLDGVEYRRKRGSFRIADHRLTSSNNQTVLDRFGTAKLYLATSVFHRSLLDRFATATDAERKVLMESLLGASQLENAQKSVKQELQELEIIEKNQNDNRRKIKNSLEFQRGRISSLIPPRITAVADEVRQALKIIAEYEKNPPEVPEMSTAPDVEEVYSSGQAIQAIVSELDTVLARIRTIEDLVAQGRCPACGGPSDTPYVQDELDDLIRRRGALERQQHDLQRVFDEGQAKRSREWSQYREAKIAFQNATRRAQLLRERVRAADQVVAQYNARVEAYDEAYRSYQANVTEARNAIAQLEAQYRALECQLALTRHRLRRLRDLLTIYGPRGARTWLLLNAFDALSKLTTETVQAITGKAYHVQLAHQEPDRILLEIVLPSGSVIPYRGLSEGEKSLIDFSLLKAISAVRYHLAAPASLPLIYDDVFDVMDDTNKQALADYISAEAQERLVFVFSHNSAVIDLFDNPETHEVIAGRVS